MCKRGRKGLYVPPGFWRYFGIAAGIVAAALVAVAISGVPERTFAAGSPQATAPSSTVSPEFPTGLSEDEIAAIQAWNLWLFEREQAYKDAMYEAWQSQMGDDAEWLFGNFEAALGDQIFDLKAEVESLKNTARANLDAAVSLQGYVTPPDPVVITEIVEVEVPVEVFIEVPVIEYIEVPGQGVREPSHYEYCAWLEARMRQLRDTAENGVDANTYRDVLLGIECEEVGLDL